MKRKIHEISMDIKDRDIVLAAVKKDGYTLQYASEELRGDNEVVMAAVRQNGLALQYASDALRANIRLVFIAVEQNGLALMYASNAVKNNQLVVFSAVKQNGLALQYASNAVKNNQLKYGNFVLFAALKQNGLALKYANNLCKKKLCIVNLALKQNRLALQYVDDSIKNDQITVISVVKACGLALQYASERLRNNKEVVLTAVSENGSASRYASEQLRTDIEFQKEAIELNPSSINGLKIAKESLGQIYGMLNPSRLINRPDMHNKRFYEGRISGLISGLIALTSSTAIYLNNSIFFKTESIKKMVSNYEHIKDEWKIELSEKIAEYLSLKDVVSLMATPANRYVVDKDGSIRPCTTKGKIKISISNDATLFSIDPDQRLARDKRDRELGNRRYLSQAMIPKVLREFVCKN